MFIDKFVEEYRDYLQAREMLFDFYESELSPNERYVLDIQTQDILRLFDFNLEFLEGNIDNIKKDINYLYSNISSKLSKIVDLAEGYQKLNTNELTESKINNLIVFDIKNRDNYDEYLNSICLPRISVVKSLKSNSVLREHINAVEKYKIPPNKVQIIGKVSIIDSNNTSLKRIVCSSKDGTELLSTTNNIFEIPLETYEVSVFTDNIDKTPVNFTTVDFLSHEYSSDLRISFEDKLLKKEGKQLKIVIDKDVPTDCYITGKLTIRYGDVSESSYFNIGNGRKILTLHSESKGEVTDIYGNRVQEDNTENDDYVLGEEYSTNPKIFSYKGNGVFDISNINSKDFYINLSFSLHSLLNKTKTPQIKGLFAYVTN